MSHHFDSAADRADGRINLCDLYAFPGPRGTSALILTVNPDAGRSSPTTFRPHIAGTAARLAGLPDPAGHAARVLEAFLPDMLTYRPGQPAAFHPATATGGRLATTPSTSLSPFSPGRRSETLPPHAKPPRRSPTCPPLNRLICRPFADYFRSPQAPAP